MIYLAIIYSLAGTEKNVFNQYAL